MQDYIDDGRLRERADGTRNPLQTVPLLDAIAEHRFDAVFGGGRRDEEKARAKERDRQPPRRVRPVGPEEPAARAVEPLQPAGTAPASTSASSRSATGPSSTSGATSSARTSSSPGLYYAHEREVFERDGMWLAVGPVSAAPRRRAGRDPARALPHRRRHVVHRAPSSRRRAPSRDVVVEVAASTLTERGATRADDRISEAAMEDRKKEGYF